ncbi:regulator of chromosome condensation, putative [Ichthyophthirius multifiliis]|uniref:Regulator of chromosome condensation, putative n=1 Tax=Ichthyophthirius multifiliis TaxID=5932 RepID=G0R1T3_ICHMU|nr:regulator of chromosome condensation, putative [Ichthyophthirius multifiliis]EGR28585.1 regulator of chromosome condensation, putative [Ichthyophthirius multifiliis]|eukprot:XP_004029821.1 regulator of chromosome condensation, putative [Ichthyophthirius multifiliis]
MALLSIHKLYGDPRGRGSQIVPWEQFIVWRLSIIARQQQKIHDAEYLEEIFDQKKDNNNNIEKQGNTNNFMFPHWVETLKFFDENKNNENDKTEASSYSKFEKNKPINQSGNIVQILEKDSSTFSKKDAIGVLYSWGQNTEGQMGNVYDPKTNNPKHRKIKINFPKLVYPLKDSIIIQVSCGYQHSVAITFNGNVLVWGDNSSSQLGLGINSPNSIYYPVQIPNIQNIINVSCGSEHTLALDNRNQVYSWGNGEGGLLGHSNEEIQASPKIIDKFQDLQVEFIICGGLHSLALTKKGHVYSWGRNEGGQLGLNQDVLKDNLYFCCLPEKICGQLEGVFVKQIAAGDAHSLALAQNGQVFGWGYNINGQLGLGQQQSDKQVSEPKQIKNLQKIEKVFCCGLNDQNQLGIEKLPIKIQNTHNQSILNQNINIIDQYKANDNSKNNNNIYIPKRMDCFYQMPVLHLSCGHNHSLAFVLADTKHYMVFAWGMNKHGQLGIGDTGQNSSMARPITYLQDIIAYSMACGSYHSLLIINDITRIIKKDVVKNLKQNVEKYDSYWNFCSSDDKLNSKLSLDISSLLYNQENIIPSDEGQIENPKHIKKQNQFYCLGPQFQ